MSVWTCVISADHVGRFDAEEGIKFRLQRAGPMPACECPLLAVADRQLWTSIPAKPPARRIHEMFLARRLALVASALVAGHAQISETARVAPFGSGLASMVIARPKALTHAAIRHPPREQRKRLG